MKARALFASFRNPRARTLCAAKTREGKRCAMIVTGDRELCRFHSGEIDLSAAGRRGGATPRGKRGKARAQALEAGGGSASGWRDMVRFAYSNGTAAALGLPVTVAELDALLALAEEAVAPEESRSPVPPSTPLLSHGDGTDAPKSTPQPTSSESHDAPLLDPGDIPEAPSDVLKRAVEIHAHNRRELGLEPDDGNADLSGQREYVAAPRVDGNPRGQRSIHV